jgi:hypothetical protein
MKLASVTAAPDLGLQVFQRDRLAGIRTKLSISPKCFCNTFVFVR